MARYVDAIDLPLPTEQAFAYLADFSNTQAWDPGVVSAQRLARGEIGLGSRFRVVVRFAGRTLSLDYEITAFEPPTRLVLRGSDGQIESIDELGFVPREGGTRVTYEACLELVGIRRLADPILDLLFQRVGRLAVRGLRERMAQGGVRRKARSRKRPETVRQIEPDHEKEKGAAI